MKKEIESSRSTFTAYDLLRTRGMRRISICLIAVWSENTPAYLYTTCIHTPVNLLSYIYSYIYINLCMYLFKYSARTNEVQSITTTDHRKVPPHQTCITIFMDLALCTGAQSCWKIKGLSPNYFLHNVGCTQLAKISSYSVALRGAFT